MAIAIASVTYYVGPIIPILVSLGMIILWQPVSPYHIPTESSQAGWYRSAGRQVRRLQAVIPGKVNAIYGETTVGVIVIRAFGVQSVLLQGTVYILRPSN